MVLPPPPTVPLSVDDAPAQIGFGEALTPVGTDGKAFTVTVTETQALL